MTIGYVIGLTLIAILSFSTHFLVDNVISQQRDTATVINVAGRQRMLSQRIGLLATDLKAGDETARQPIKDALALMLRSENALIHGDDLGISQPLSVAARELYFEGPTPLDPAVRAFIKSVQRYVDHVADEPVDDTYRSLQLDAHSTLLPSLNQAVTIFESEANERVKWLRTAQQIVLVVLLTTLSLEAMFIFRPLVKRVRRYAANLYELATRDSLTGLANRRYFMETAGRELLLARRAAEPISGFILDLDHFKQVNDTYGHAVGDAVLRQFAAVATRTLRATDALGRIGGEEFALVLPGMELSAARLVAEKLRAAIAEDRGVGIPAFTVSVGVGTAKPEDQGIEELLRRADEALYQAKNGGRNRIAVHGEPDTVLA